MPKLDGTCSFENTSDEELGFGQYTRDEMCFIYTLAWPIGKECLLRLHDGRAQLPGPVIAYPRAVAYRFGALGAVVTSSEPKQPSFELQRGPFIRHRTFGRGPDDCDEAQAVLGLAIAVALDESLSEARESLVRLQLAFLQIGAGYSVVLNESVGGQLGLELAWGRWLRTRAALLVQYSAQNALGDGAHHFDAWIASSMPLLAASVRRARHERRRCHRIVAVRAAVKHFRG